MTRLQGQLTPLEPPARSRKMGPDRGQIPARRHSGCEKPMLLFKRRFLDDIRSGTKTQTIRLWKHRMMRTGQRSYIPGVGPIRIDSVEEVEVDKLTDADAQPDGFATAAELQRELRAIYREKLDNGHRAYRVVFQRVSE
jgi:hypothetical protein